MKNYVITIARGFGSGGKYIGTQLAKELGIPCYERQILTLASEKSGIDESLFVEVDEKLRGSYIGSLLSKIQYTTVLNPEEKEFCSDTNLFNIQARIIRELAKTQSCIIVGKCADYILKDYPNVISIYIEADHQYCVKSIVDKMGVSEERANYLIKKTDKYRRNYYKYYTYGGDWTDPMHYDMIINTSKTGRKSAIDILKAYVVMKCLNV